MHGLIALHQASRVDLRLMGRSTRVIATEHQTRGTKNFRAIARPLQPIEHVDDLIPTQQKRRRFRRRSLPVPRLLIRRRSPRSASR